MRINSEIRGSIAFVGQLYIHLIHIMQLKLNIIFLASFIWIFFAGHSKTHSHIEILKVATPLTLKRYTGNTDGALYGWANAVDQGSPLNRMSQKTHIKNLYLSSAWTFPGGGSQRLPWLVIGSAGKLQAGKGMMGAQGYYNLSRKANS